MSMRLIAFCTKILIFIFVFFFIGGNVYSLDSDTPSIFKKVLEQNQPALIVAHEEWPDEDFYPYIMRCMKYQAALNDQKKYGAVFKMLDNSLLKKQFIGNTICDDLTTWQDLNLFAGQKDLSIYLASIVDRTRTSFGHAVLYAMLVNPTASKKELERRQGIIRHLLENPEFLDTLDKGLQKLQESENMVVSFWCDDPIRQEIKKDRYLKWPIQALNNYVNTSQTCLALLNSWSHFERFIYLRDYILGGLCVTAYHSLSLLNIKSAQSLQETSEWLQQDRGINGGAILSECVPRIDNATGKNIIGLLAGLYAIMNIQEWASWTHDQLFLDSCLHMKIMHVAKCFEGLKQLHAIVDQSDYLTQQLSTAQSLDALFDPQVKKTADVEKLLALLMHPALKEKPSFFTHKGRMLLGFKLMNENKEIFEPAFAAIGEIDMFVSLAKLIKEHEHQRVTYCFAQFVESHKPVLAIQDLWNPFIDTKKVVPNSLSLGTNSMPGNIIITGPYAGGKSTILKTMAINVLMAQSFGIAPAREIILTPFSKITTYMNIRDDIAAGNSLFKAQVLRAQELFKFVQSLDKDRFCFVIIDEMFNGASPREAEASAYSVAKNLGQHANAMCLIATHFSLLTTLATNTNCFSNYSVQVEQSDNGTISCSFIVTPGISHQHVALDILKAEGFSGAILDDAHAIINNHP